MDLDALVAKASAILDAAAKPFIAGHRADSAVSKRGDDFATNVDLAIERQVVDALVSATGIPVHGEEFGGADLDSEWVWVLDPVDGTFNYAAGSPMAAILLGLLHDGDPVAGLTWLPFMGERYAAVVGGPVLKNGVPQPPLAAHRSHRIDHRGRNVQRRLARPISGTVPGGGARRAQPGVIADADARRHRHRSRLRRRRSPRRLDQFRRPRMGSRGRRGAGAGRRRCRHQSRRRTMDTRFAFRAGRRPRRARPAARHAARRRTAR